MKVGLCPISRNTGISSYEQTLLGEDWLMDREILICSLWFNSSKKDMCKRLDETQNNGGVGIHIGKHIDYFDPQVEFVDLRFDDGTHGKARVKKDGWDNTCTHLISESIGAWARRNGLWKSKLKHRSVPVYLQIIERAKVFKVSSQYP